MPTNAATATRPTFPWWIILCLVGLDYFSSIAYLPSVALGAMGQLAPVAAIAVVLVTLGAAVPVYFYVVGRSPHGQGGIGLLQQVAHGWRGKLLLLVLLGFIATDFVLTRTLSVSDAATHILHNPHYRDGAEQITRNAETIRGYFPPLLAGKFFDFWSEQLLLTVFLSIVGFSFYWLLARGISHGFMGLAVFTVALYLLVNVLVIGAALLYLRDHPNLIITWERDLPTELRNYRADTGGVIRAVLLLCVLAFPMMAMGLSGFELSLTSAPLIQGAASDRPNHPAGRIFRTRLMIICAALIMSVLVLSSIFVTTLLVPLGALESPHGIHHRALAYLAHGELLADGQNGTEVSSLFGSTFGTIYDLSTVLILCLAGATATVSLKELVPEFLSRFGMQLSWAHRLDIITHLFNVVILLVTVAFQASVSDQLGAYAAAVLALLFGASLAATLDVGQRWRSPIGWFLRIPFALATLLFVVMGALIVLQQSAGVLISLAFVAVVMTTALLSRALRSTELRFDGFEFSDKESESRWNEVSKLEFQVLVPHNPSREILKNKESQMRERHRLGANVPIIFIEVHLGDTSDFYQKPLMKIVREEGREVIRVSRCTSVSHVLAAIALAFREVGSPPEIHFTWSKDTPLEATVGFLLFGQGNIPWMVHALIRKAEPREERQPHVMIG